MKLSDRDSINDQAISHDLFNDRNTFPMIVARKKYILGALGQKYLDSNLLGSAIMVSYSAIAKSYNIEALKSNAISCAAWHSSSSYEWLFCSILKPNP